MKHHSVDKMSKTQLIRELERLQSTQRRLVAHLDDADPKRVLYDLETHQIEIEMQNRELLESQQRLEESRGRYSDLYDFAPVGYCTLDHKGRIVEINRTGAELLEAPKEQLIDKSFRSVVAFSNPDVFETHISRCAKEKTRVTSDLTLLFRDGTQRTVRMITDPMVRGSQKPPVFRTILIDITEEKRFEDELLLLSNLGAVLIAPLDYREALEAAARILIPALADLLKIDLLNDAGRIERFLVLFADHRKQETLAERMMQFYPRPGWKTAQAKVIESGEPMLLAEVPDVLRDRMAHDKAHADILRAAGVRSMMVMPLTVRGRTFGAITFATAESRRRYSASNFRLAGTVANRIATTIDNARLFDDRMKAVTGRDAVLAVVSHDLRNSINVIQLKTYLMLQRADTQSREDAAFIRRRADEMGRLIQDLLDISSLEAGQLRMEKSRQAVVPIVKKTLEAFEFQAAQKSLKLDTEFRVGEELRADCDPDRIQQVLANLIGNAIKFTSFGGSILVRVVPRRDDICFSVSDSGPGIPEPDLLRVFDRFWHAVKSGRRGTGLGLTIAKGLVETHGGRIWAESKIGHGSTFFFTLPTSHPERSAPRERTETVRPSM